MPIFSRPQYSTVTAKKKDDIPRNLFIRCPLSKEIVYIKELERNMMVVPKSGYHFPFSAHERVKSMLDAGTFEEKDDNLKPVDALGFCDRIPYEQRLVDMKKRTGMHDAVICGTGEIGKVPVSIAVMDFRFMAASMGAVVGEKITRAIERSAGERRPLIVVCASGGARMQEGIFSLMQMAKTSAALGRLHEAGVPFISILTHPTTGGVTASFAVLGDIILAEPGALVGFAGPRVIQETIKKELPDGFQTAEFLLRRGLIDQIVPRTEMRKRLIEILHVFHVGKQPAAALLGNGKKDTKPGIPV